MEKSRSQPVLPTYGRHGDAVLEWIGYALNRIGEGICRAGVWFYDEVDDRRLRREIARGDRVYDPETKSWPRKA